jgi:hypothetical protein
MTAPVDRVTGPFVVTVAQDVDGATVEALWELYRTAFDGMQHRAAARQLLTRDEFSHEVVDRRVSKYLVRDDGGAIWGLVTLTNDLTTVPWISPEFYAARYPEHAARQAVYYGPLAMVHPRARGSRAFRQLVEAFGRDVAADDGVLAVDMCRFNVDVVELHDTLTEVLTDVWGAADCVRLDTQVYLGWERPPVA